MIVFASMHNGDGQWNIAAWWFQEEQREGSRLVGCKEVARVLHGKRLGAASHRAVKWPRSGYEIIPSSILIST